MFWCLSGCGGWQLCSRLCAWNGLPVNKYISVYARTKKCNNERVSRTNDFRCGIPQCICNFHKNSRLNENITQDLPPK